MIAGIAVLGCSREPDPLPLAQGNRWSYSVRWGLQQRVDEVSVAAPLSVAGGAGWRLEGLLGSSRLAWLGDRLVAEELGGVRYAPAIPLAFRGAAPRQEAWQGLASVDGRLLDASAKLAQAATKIEFGGRTLAGIRTLVSLNSAGNLVELETDFVPGVGIVRQEQRVNGRLERALELLSGP